MNKEKKLSKDGLFKRDIPIPDLIEFLRKVGLPHDMTHQDGREHIFEIIGIIESPAQELIKINQDCIANIQCPHCRKKIKISYLKTFFSQEPNQTYGIIEELDGVKPPKKPSEAKLEEFVEKLARDVRGWFIRWREQYPEENKDIDELPHQNAKNIVSILLKEYEALREGKK